MSSEQYRGFAKDCLRWAEETISEEDHQHFIAMAKAWMHAAAELSEVSETVGMSGKAEPKRKSRPLSRAAKSLIPTGESSRTCRRAEVKYHASALDRSDDFRDQPYGQRREPDREPEKPAYWTTWCSSRHPPVAAVNLGQSLRNEPME